MTLKVLKEVLARMGGVDTVEQMSQGQIESRASGDTLRAETRHGVYIHHILYPLYTFITIYTPMVTLYTCIYAYIYVIYTPNTPLNTL